MADMSCGFSRPRDYRWAQLEVVMAIGGFHKAPPLTPRDRILYPWLIAYRGGARRPLWGPTGGGRYRVIVPKWVKVPKESKDDPGLQPTSEDPDA
jgi:hypothetical protein